MAHLDFASVTSRHPSLGKHFTDQWQGNSFCLCGMNGHIESEDFALL